MGRDSMKESGQRGKGSLPALLFIFILVLQIVNALYWGNCKEGYYIDELWSYGLANSLCQPFLQNQEGYMEQWHGPDFYMDYLTVDREETFSYKSVYYNQTQDVHPPLYYMLLHTVCSLWPGEFSKWFGVSLNLLVFCGTIWLLYRIGGLLFGRTDAMRLLPPLLYGFSCGAISTVMYIRMYMLLTFWVLLFVLLSFQAMEDGCRPLVLAGLCLTVAAGFLTQYYFLIAAFFVSAGYVLWRLWNRRIKEAIWYAAAVLTGIGMGILAFPAALSHIFLGEQGRDSFANASQGLGAFYGRLREYDKLVSREFFGVWFGLDLLIVLLIVAAVLTLRGKQGKPETKVKGIGAMCCILLLTALGYFCLVSQISTDIVDRYQFAIFPIGILAVVAILYRMLSRIGKSSWLWGLAAAYLVLCAFCYGKGGVNYIQKGYAEAEAALRTEYREATGIYVTPGDHLVINDCLLLAQQDRTFPIREELLEELPGICGENPGESLVLYVNVYYYGEQTAEKVAGLLGYQKYELLYDNTFTKIYVLSQPAGKEPL